MEKITNENPLSHSEDLVASNIEQLKALFPEIVTEGKIDFKVLQSILGEEIEEGEEYYRFTWAGKAQARREAHKPSTATLRPCKEDSVDWDKTQNMYIEGDNLEVLKLLQKSYARKVKIIYIDPPYNTGKDFIYRDNYKDNLKNYQEITGQIDSDGNKLTTNSDSEGRFHSNWLNMMYPRLRLARNLLKEDGVIFLSIDNDEVENLKKLGNEVFGESNFIECITWNKRVPKNDKGIGNIHEYVLIYVKNSSHEHVFTMPKDGLDDIYNLVAQLKKNNILIVNAEKEVKKLYKKKGYDRGITLYNSLDKDYRLWGKINMSWPNANTFGPRYEVLHPKTKKAVKIPARGWRWKEDTFKEVVDFDNIEELPDGSFKCGGIWFAPDENTQPSSIKFLDDVNDMLLRSIISLKSDGGIETEKLFGNKSLFSYPKPTSLISTLLNSLKPKDDIILDFFSGSATTIESVLRLNSETNQSNKFISVQLPENLEESFQNADSNTKSTIKNAIDYLTSKNKPLFLTELGKERIRRVGKKIAEENPEKAKDLDLGFKVFKLDSSNIRSWDGNLEDKELDAVLKDFIENTKDSEITVDENGQTIPNPDIRTQEDIMYEILLKYGLDLTLPIEEKEVAGKTVFNVGFGALFICLGNNITSAVAEGIGEWIEKIRSEIKETITDTELIKKLIEDTQKCRVVFKDNGFTDVEKTNSVQILKRFGIAEIKTL